MSDYKNVINPHQTPSEVAAQSRFLDKMFAALERKNIPDFKTWREKLLELDRPPRVWPR